jgi:hypothetical protein
VSEIGDSDTAAEIEVLLTVLSVDERPLRPLGDDGRELPDAGRHVRRVLVVRDGAGEAGGGGSGGRSGGCDGGEGSRGDHRRCADRRAHDGAGQQSGGGLREARLQTGQHGSWRWTVVRDAVVLKWLIV